MLDCQHYPELVLFDFVSDSTPPGPCSMKAAIRRWSIPSYSAAGSLCIDNWRRKIVRIIVIGAGGHFSSLFKIFLFFQC